MPILIVCGFRCMSTGERNKPDYHPLLMVPFSGSAGAW